MHEPTRARADAVPGIELDCIESLRRIIGNFGADGVSTDRLVRSLEKTLQLRVDAYARVTGWPPPPLELPAELGQTELPPPMRALLDRATQ